MIEINGKYTNAKIFTDNVDDLAIGQIIHLVNEPIAKDMQIRIMPDVNYAKGTVVGTSMLSLSNKLEIVSPSIIGTDIGCGVLIRKVKIDKRIKFDKLDKIIAKAIPSGAKINDSEEVGALSALRDLSFKIDKDRMSIFARSLGTLGGGNHFIELGQDESGDYWLSVHTGSRILGQEVYNWHTMIARENFKKQDTRQVNFAYLEGSTLDNYLNDVRVAQLFAHLNRKLILDKICQGMKWSPLDEIDSVHNYIDLENSIIRKGATSSQENEKQIIPLNMRDGFLIASGKGNYDWNYSAPHGSGRKHSRSKAKESLDLNRFKSEMQGIYSTSVGKSTLDESPMAYKKTNEIISLIDDTLEIDLHVKPKYNFKAH